MRVGEPLISCLLIAGISSNYYALTILSMIYPTPCIVPHYAVHMCNKRKIGNSIVTAQTNVHMHVLMILQMNMHTLARNC